MKRLLLLPILCLMPAAQAVDYAQCEAMQKAATRLKNSMEVEANRARQAVNNGTAGAPKKSLHEIMMECAEEFRGNSKAAIDCQISRSMGSVNEGNQAADAVRAEWAPRIAKVQADYIAAGCY